MRPLRILIGERIKNVKQKTLSDKVKNVPNSYQPRDVFKAQIFNFMLCFKAQISA